MEFELEKGICNSLLRIERIKWSNMNINWCFMINREINKLYADLAIGPIQPGARPARSPRYWSEPSFSGSKPGSKPELWPPSPARSSRAVFGPDSVEPTHSRPGSSPLGPARFLVTCEIHFKLQNVQCCTLHGHNDVWSLVTPSIVLKVPWPREVPLFWRQSANETQQRKKYPASCHEGI